MFKGNSNMRLTSDVTGVCFNTVCKVINQERRLMKSDAELIKLAKPKKHIKPKKNMTEPFAVTALKLYREFNCITSVANFLGVRYAKIIHILHQEKTNQDVAKKLAKMDVSEWPNRYAESQSRHAKWRRLNKDKINADRREQKKQRAITFGYGGNDFLKGDVVERNTHKHDDQVRIRKTGSKQRFNHDYSPALWQQ